MSNAHNNIVSRKAIQTTGVSVDLPCHFGLAISPARCGGTAERPGDDRNIRKDAEEQYGDGSDGPGVISSRSRETVALEALVDNRSSLVHRINSRFSHHRLQRPDATSQPLRYLRELDSATPIRLSFGRFMLPRPSTHSAAKFEQGTAVFAIAA